MTERERERGGEREREKEKEREWERNAALKNVRSVLKQVAFKQTFVHSFFCLSFKREINSTNIHSFCDAKWVWGVCKFKINLHEEVKCY